MSVFQSPEIKFVEKFDGSPAFPAIDNDATVAIVGICEKGPIGVATRVTSYGEFRAIFGAFLNDAEMAFWIEHFFTNSGGQGELYIVRTAHYADITDITTLAAIKASTTLPNEGPSYSLSGTAPVTATAVGRTDFQVAISGEVAQTINLDYLHAGTSTSDAAPATVTGVGSTDLDIALSGEAAQTISINNALVTGATIAAAIQVAVRALTAAVPANQPDYEAFTAVFAGGLYVLTNGTQGAGKDVVVTNAGANNMADELKLGVANGGTEDAGEDAVINGLAVAAAIQVAVRALTAAVPANQPDYDAFLCVFTEDGRYLLLNGTVGAGKDVVVTNAISLNAADDFKLGVANGGTEDAYPIDAVLFEAYSEGIHGNALSTTTSMQNKVNTTLTVDLVDGDTQISVRRPAGIVPGQYLQITDQTAPLASAFVSEVDRVEGDIVFLRDAVVLTETVEGTGATPAEVKSLEFQATFYLSGKFLEKFDYLSMNPRNTDAYFVTRITNESPNIVATDLSAPSLPDTSRPDPVTAQMFTGGVDGLASLGDTDFIGDEVARNGMQAIRDLETINFLVVPDRPTVAVHQAMLDLAAELDRFEVILDPPLSYDENDISEHVIDNQLASDYASIYWPNLYMSDPRRRTDRRLIAPSAYVLGMRSKNANTPGIGVGRPPAGRRFVAQGVVGLESDAGFRKEVRDTLKLARVNPIAGFIGSIGFFPFGVDTLLPGGTGNGVGEVQARAVVLRVKRNVLRIVREHLLSDIVDEEILSRLTGEITAYLRVERAEGNLIGRNDADSFAVDFSLGQNPPEAMARGEVKGKIALRLGRALKYVVIEISEHVPAKNQSPA
jgi:hypothetical protein